MVTVKKLILFILFLTLNTAAFGLITAQVDRTELYEDENLLLTVRVSPKAELRAVDIEALKSLFDVVYSGQSSSQQTINGKRSTSSEYQFQLAPKKTGTLGIPNFRIGSQQSKPIFVNVIPSGKRIDGIPGDAIIFDIISSNDEVYVDQNVTMTIRLAYRIALAGQFEQYDFSSLESFEVSKIESTEVIAGMSYKVFERVVRVPASQPGIFTFPEMKFVGQYQDPATRRTRTLVRTATPPKLIIKQIPSTFPKGYFWLPAKSFKISDNLASQQTIDQSEHLNWQIIQQAQDLEATRFPDPMTLIKGQKQIKVYNNPPEFKAQQNFQQRLDIAAITFNQPGEITLDTIRIPWWNVESDSLEWAELPARTITVIPTVQSQSTSEASTITPTIVSTPGSTTSPDANVQQSNEQTDSFESNDNLFWRAAAISLLILWLLTVAPVGYYFWAIKQRNVKHQDHIISKKQHNDSIHLTADNFYGDLLIHLRVKGKTLHSLKEYLSKESLSTLLNAENSAYSGNENIDTANADVEKLNRECNNFINDKANTATNSGDSIKLYPA